MALSTRCTVRLNDSEEERHGVFFSDWDARVVLDDFRVCTLAEVGSMRVREILSHFPALPPRGCPMWIPGVFWDDDEESGDVGTLVTIEHPDQPRPMVRCSDGSIRSVRREDLYPCFFHTGVSCVDDIASFSTTNFALYQSWNGHSYVVLRAHKKDEIDVSQTLVTLPPTHDQVDFVDAVRALSDVEEDVFASTTRKRRREEGGEGGSKDDDRDKTRWSPETPLLTNPSSRKPGGHGIRCTLDEFPMPVRSVLKIEHLRKAGVYDVTQEAKFSGVYYQHHKNVIQGKERFAGYRVHNTRTGKYVTTTEHSDVGALLVQASKLDPSLNDHLGVFEWVCKIQQDSEFCQSWVSQVTRQQDETAMAKLLQPCKKQ